MICSGKIRLRVKIFEFCPVNRFWLQCFDIYVFNDCPMCVDNCFFVILNGFKYSFVCRNVEKKNPQCLSQGKTRNHTVCFDLSKTPIETKHLTFLTGHDRLNIIFRF